MSVSYSDPTYTLTTTASTQAVLELPVTTTEEGDKVSFSFEVGRNTLYLRVGSSSGDQDILPDLQFPSGKWVVSFTPGVTSYYVQFSLRDVGKATLTDFQREAAGPLVLATPWNTDDQSLIRMQQSLNVVYAVEPTKRQQVIERRGATSWGIRDFTAVDGPFRPLNATSTTLTPAARTGETTITASAPTFVTSDAGSLLQLTHAGQYETESFTAVSQTTDTIRVTGIEDTRKFFYSRLNTGTGNR